VDLLAQVGDGAAHHAGQDAGLDPPGNVRRQNGELADQDRGPTQVDLAGQERLAGGRQQPLAARPRSGNIRHRSNVDGGRNACCIGTVDFGGRRVTRCVGVGCILRLAVGLGTDAQLHVGVGIKLDGWKALSVQHPGLVQHGGRDASVGPEGSAQQRDRGVDVLAVGDPLRCRDRRWNGTGECGDGRELGAGDPRQDRLPRHRDR
jgi:hypothetical protein